MIRKISILVLLVMAVEFFAPVMSVVSFGPSEAYAKMMCTYDLSGDVYTDTPDEVAECINTAQGYLCPLHAANCTETLADGSCPSGSILNPATDKCEATPDISCPSGYTYDSSLDKCLQSATCPSNGVLNTNTDKCEILFSDSLCPLGYTYDSTYQACIKDVTCPSGSTYNSARDRCEISVSYSCPSGYSYNSATNKCEVNPSCPNGFTYNTTANACVQSAALVCPSGYTYNSSTGKCEINPVCPAGGSYSNANNRCEAGVSYSYTCSVNGQTYSDQTQCNNACIQTASCNPASVTASGDVLGGDKIQIVGSGNTINFYNQTTDGEGYPVGGSFTYTGSITLSGATASGEFVTNSFGCHTWIFGSGNTINFWYATHYSMGSFTLSGATASGGGQNPYCSSPVRVVGSGNTINFYWWGSGWNLFASIALTSTTYTCPLSGGSACSGSPQTCSKATACTTNAVCPAGYVQSGGICVANSSCPSGGSLNTATDKCEITPIFSCPSGSTYDSALGMCAASATCPTGGSLNGTTDKCEAALTPVCEAGYTYDSAIGLCYSSPICGEGSFDPAIDKCKVVASSLCPSGYTYNSSNNKCEQSPLCDGTSAYSPTADQCVLDAEYNCPLSMYYSHISRMCEADPLCSEGTYVPEKDKCLIGNTTCPFGSQYICMDNGGVMQCSTSQCGNVDDPSNLEITSVDDNMLKDDGPKDAEGNCLGPIYIFTGRAMTCHPSGYDNSWKDCCDVEAGAAMSDSVGSVSQMMTAVNTVTTIYEAVAIYVHVMSLAPFIESIGLVATEVAAEAVTNYLVGLVNPTTIAIAVVIYVVMELFSKGCNQQDAETSMLNKSKMCHYVGEYCQTKFMFGGCVQKAKAYCCFNSKLARIIHEQGRPMLKTFQGSVWGDTKQPNCRGLTPEEFQGLDFSQMDLSEYFEDIKTKATAAVQQAVGDKVQKYYDNIKK